MEWRDPGREREDAGAAALDILSYAAALAGRLDCPWKGEASYYNVAVDGQTNKDAAWFYPSPKPAAAEIRDYVAFWHGVKVEE